MNNLESFYCLLKYMPKEEQQLNSQDQNILANKGLKNYQPVYGPTTKQLEWGLWWIEHKNTLKRILTGTLIFLNVIFWVYSLFYLGEYVYSGILQDKVLARAAIKSDVINHKRTLDVGALPLNLGNVQVFRGLDAQTYDLSVETSNPNEDWYAEFDYFFTVGQNTTDVQKEFIMPKETKYITYFLYQGQNSASSRLDIKNLQWLRVDKTKFGNIAEYIKSHNDIAITDISFRSDNSGNIPFNYVSFQARNNSAYNYWGVDLHLTLTSGTRLLGVNKYQMTKFMSEQSQNVEIFWSGSLSGGQISIKPSINVFDQQNYISFDLGPGQLK